MLTSGTASGKSLAFNLPVLDAIARDPKARALYLYPTKALAQDQARKLAELRLAPPPPRDLRRRHAPRRAPGDPPSLEPRAHQPGHAQHGDPRRHHKGWGDFLANLELGRRRRGPHLPRSVRLARRQRPAPAATGRPPLRLRARASSAPRRRSPTRPSSPSELIGLDVRAGRLRRRPARAAADRDLEPAGDRPEDDDPPLGALGGRRAARRPRDRGSADDLLPAQPPRDRADPALHAGAPRGARRARSSRRGSLPTARATRRSSGARSRRGWPAASCSPWSPPTRSSSGSTSASSTPRSASPSRARSPACARCGGAPVGAATGSRSTSPGRTRSTSSSAAIRTSSSPARSRRRSSTRPTSGSRPRTCSPRPTRRRSAAGRRGREPTTTSSSASAGAIAPRRWSATGELRRGRDGRYLPRGPGFPAGELSLRSASADTVAVVERASGEMLGQVEAERALLDRPPGRRSTCTWGARTRSPSSTSTARRAIVDRFDGDWYTQPKKETDGLHRASSARGASSARAAPGSSSASARSRSPSR